MQVYFKCRGQGINYITQKKQAGSNMLKFVNYRKAYNGKPIVEIGNLMLEAGTYWLKGENGSGKSTLLKSIGGLIPYEGEISVHGLPDNRKNRMKYRSIVNYGEANPEYPRFLRGNDLLMLYKNAKAGGAEQLDYLINSFGIEKFKNEKIGDYSSGMVKKLSLALAFIGNPGLILLDEPLITLDKDAVQVILKLISEQSKKGVSVIFSSHQDFMENGTLTVQQLLLNNGTLNF
jgi:ABC-2 type transport system ATP-binding protein